MNHPFAALAGEYASLLHTARVRPERAHEIDAVARRLIGFLPRYAAVSARTGVPAVWLATVFEREASSNFHLYFGNGDPLDRPTRDVPRGRGPFTGPNAWEDGAIDALHYDRIDAVTDWSLPRFCYEGEAWNGFGPRAHGIHTGYLWAGMTPYTAGKYVRDGEWDPTHEDTQLGIVPVALRMIALAPSLVLSDMGPVITAAEAATTPPPAPAVPQPAPDGLGGSIDNVKALQRLLNAQGLGPIAIDGSYGWQTRRAVKAFQAAHGLEADGLAGPRTDAALVAAVAKAPATVPATALDQALDEFAKAAPPPIMKG